MNKTAAKHTFPYDMTKDVFQSLFENLPAAFKQEAFNAACPASSLLEKVVATLSQCKNEENFIKEHGAFSYDLCQLFVAMQTLTMLAEMDEEDEDFDDEDDSDFEDEDDSDFEDEDDSDFDEEEESEEEESEEELSVKKPHLHLMSKKNHCCGHC